MKKWIVLSCALALILPSAASAGPPVREHPGADKDQSANHGDCKNPGPKGDWANEPGQPKTTGWHNGYDCGPAPVVTPPPVKLPKVCPPPPPVCSCPTAPSAPTTTTNVTNVTNVTVVKVVRVKAKPRHHAKRHAKRHRKHHRRHATPKPHHRAPLFAG